MPDIREFSELKALVARLAHRELTELDMALIDVKILEIIKKEFRELKPQA